MTIERQPCSPRPGRNDHPASHASGLFVLAYNLVLCGGAANALTLGATRTLRKAGKNVCLPQLVSRVPAISDTADIRSVVIVTFVTRACLFVKVAVYEPACRHGLGVRCKEGRVCRNDFHDYGGGGITGGVRRICPRGAAVGGIGEPEFFRGKQMRCRAAIPPDYIKPSAALRIVSPVYHKCAAVAAIPLVFINVRRKILIIVLPRKRYQLRVADQAVSAGQRKFQVGSARGDSIAE